MQSFIGFSLVSVLAFLVIRRLLSRHHNTLPLPPGPKGLPLVGNLRDIASIAGSPWVTYSKWSRVHGDVLHLNAFGHHTVVLNSLKVVNDLFDKRSENYSDRPDMPMLIDLMGMGWNFGAMRYSDQWRLHRRTFHQLFQSRAVPQYFDIQRTATVDFMKKLESTPDDFFQHVRHQSGWIILKSVYGYTLQTRDDPYLQLVQKSFEGLLPAGIHGSFWVDYFPVLKYLPDWLPGASFKRKAKIWRQYISDMKEKPWDWVKQATDYGTTEHSFSTRSADRLSVTLGEGSVMEDVIKHCAAVAYLAGSDTTVASVLSFILAMTLHPELQTRAQKEIDAVIGSERLPDFDDRDRLPFVNALLAETARWNPVTPLGVAHRALNDDIYNDYTIPAGATVLSNIWAIMHDESLFGPNTFTFNPDRFLETKGKTLPDPETIAFGFGRRICPGRYLAINTVYLTVTYLLATFTIVKDVDEEGKEIVPKVEFTDGLLSHPKPFKCRFIPRESSSLAMA
ncbi:hypothetical protein PQX77_017400 [Marasmius sp. AFHP31]|nr:hypothetical protein PQX77_017400 [Marasmius sp. AFHP31]